VRMELTDFGSEDAICAMGRTEIKFFDFRIEEQKREYLQMQQGYQENST